MTSAEGHPQEYFAMGETWDNEIFASIVHSRNRAWLLSFFCMGATLLALLSLVLLLPLKTFAPYVVTVDKSTGYVEVTKGLYDGAITPDDAVTESNLVRYVGTREAYNPSVLRENYNQVTLMSAGKALEEYRRLWDGKNPDNPSVRMGTSGTVAIHIKSVAFLNERTAEVRFQREYRAVDRTSLSDWNAIIDFQYVNKPMKMEERFQNPLGFQVLSYRINPETPELPAPTHALAPAQSQPLPPTMEKTP
jgi:type IV secretion system protein VirB8